MSSPSATKPSSSDPFSSPLYHLLTQMCDRKNVIQFIQRYNQAMASKLYDVEELVDFYMHRRLAALLAVAVSYVPFVITPNQITLFGLLLGWASAGFLYDAYFPTVLNFEPRLDIFYAGVLMFLWIVSDCADGQVARLCKRGTRTGRILDGVVDGLVIAPNMLIIGWIMELKYGAFGFYCSVFAGLSLWIHAIAYDKIKNVYMENALPSSECDGESWESVYEEYSQANIFTLDWLLLGIYYRYLRVQSGFVLPPTSKSMSSHSIAQVEASRGEYVALHYETMRLASFLGISAHVTAIYVMHFIHFYSNVENWIALHIYFSVILNGVLVSAIVLYKRNKLDQLPPPTSTRAAPAAASSRKHL